LSKSSGLDLAASAVPRGIHHPTRNLRRGLGAGGAPLLGGQPAVGSVPPERAPGRPARAAVNVHGSTKLLHSWRAIPADVGSHACSIAKALGHTIALAGQTRRESASAAEPVLRGNIVEVLLALIW
jgi:hypothetical protein